MERSLYRSVCKRAGEEVQDFLTGDNILTSPDVSAILALCSADIEPHYSFDMAHQVPCRPIPTWSFLLPTDDNLKLLAEAEDLYMDGTGTFKSSPRLFHQAYSL